LADCGHSYRLPGAFTLAGEGHHPSDIGTPAQATLLAALLEQCGLSIRHGLIPEAPLSKVQHMRRIASHDSLIHCGGS
jgi:hypothetical protein